MATGNLALSTAEETNFKPVEWMQGWIRAAWSRDLAKNQGLGWYNGKKSKGSPQTVFEIHR